MNGTVRFPAVKAAGGAGSQPRRGLGVHPVLGLELRGARGCPRVWSTGRQRPVWSQGPEEGLRVPATGAAPPACPRSRPPPLEWPTDCPPASSRGPATHSQVEAGARPSWESHRAEGPQPPALSPFRPWVSPLLTQGRPHPLEAEQGSGPCGGGMGLGAGPGTGDRPVWEVEMGVPSLRSRSLQLK